MSECLTGIMPEPSEHLLVPAPLALVTGGAVRLGRAIALALARDGFDIVFTWHTSAQPARDLSTRIRRLGRLALPIRIDLSKSTAPARLRQALLTRLPAGAAHRLSVLINNAAIYQPTPLARLTPADFDRHLAINARAPLLLIQQLADLLAHRYRPEDPFSAGRVINLLDMHVLAQHRPDYLAYAASKAALLEITRTTALALAPKITVNAIAPGVALWNPTCTPAQRRRYLQRVPLARAGTPEDIARTVLFLVRQAPYITGQVIVVDGGRSLT